MLSERRQGAIRLTPLDAAPGAARNLCWIKNEVSPAAEAGAADRHPQGDAAAHRRPRPGCLRGWRREPRPRCWPSVSMLAIYGYGTNTGIRAATRRRRCAPEEEARYVRRRYLTPAVAQALAVGIANATFNAATPACGQRLDRGRLGLDPLRRLGPEPVHRMALPLPRPRSADLLARRAQEHGHPPPNCSTAPRPRSPDGRRVDAPRHRDERARTTSTPTASR